MTGAFLGAAFADSQLLGIAFGPDGNIYVPALQSIASVSLE